MASRDYKHRAATNSGRYHAGKQAPARPPAWRWLVVAALIAVFGFLAQILFTKLPILLRAWSGAEVSVPRLREELQEELKQVLPLPGLNSSSKSAAEADKTPPAQTPAAQQEAPRFDFYTILPDSETVVPDYEIQTREREEFVGKSKPVKYIMQAGSFQKQEEAERLKRKLAELGIESQIETAKIGASVWRRVKIGPYNNPSSVTSIKELLQKNGIGVLVTESE